MFHQGVSVPVKTERRLEQELQKDQLSAKEPKIIYFNFFSIHIACENNKLSN